MIALDAVPFQVAAELTDPSRGDQALFRDLKGPVPLVSTFPSSTSVAMVGILAPYGLAKSPGYEARFFDWQEMKVKGGGLLSYHEIDFPWRDFFDWSRKGPVGSAIEGLRPVKYSIKRLRRALRDFATNDKQNFFVYIAPTDTAAHMKGPEALKTVLIGLDEILTDLRRSQIDRPFEVVIFSDHGLAGGEPLQNVKKGIKQAVKKAGYRRAKRLRNSEDVVLTPFGLVSSVEAYVLDEEKSRVSSILASVPGVDLCAIETEKGWMVESSNGTASFWLERTTPEDIWHYEPTEGDPFGYLPLIASNRRQSGNDSSGLADEDWFTVTAEASYPDALYRLAQAFSLVENPASIICSLAPGYMYGSGKTERLAVLGGGHLKWTHGALYREATLGFLMSDVPGWAPPSAARFDRGLLPFVGVADMP